MKVRKVDKDSYIGFCKFCSKFVHSDGAQLNAAVAHGVWGSCTARSVPTAHSVVVLSSATVTDTQRWLGLPPIHPLSSVLRQVASPASHWGEKVCKIGI